MAVRFILGRAGSGKTRHCVDAIAAALSEDDGPPLLMLAPEQATFQLEQMIALRAARRGYWRLLVLGFSRLAQRWLDEYPAAAIVSDAECHLALHLVLQQETEALRCFGAAAETPGFRAGVARFIARAQTECLEPAALAAAARKLDDPDEQRRLLALVRCWQTYCTWIGPLRIDPQQRTQAAAALQTPPDWLRGARVWVDGFAGFTGQEIRLLTRICAAAESVEITLLVDANSQGLSTGAIDPLSLFGRTEQTARRLRAELETAGVRVEPPLRLGAARRFAGARGLAELEGTLALPPGVPRAKPAQPVSGAVRLVACPTARDEVRAAAAWIRRRIVAERGALRYRDFAFIVRDVRVFAAHVIEIFNEHEIPFFIDQRRSLQTHALGRFVTALGDVVQHGGGLGAVRRLLQSELLPLNRAACERLENDFLNSELEELADWSPGRGWPSEAVTRVRRVVGRLAQAQAEWRAAPGRTAREWSAWWSGLLGDLEVGRTLEQWAADARRRGAADAAQLHRQAWQTLCELLDALAGLGEQTPLPAAALRAALESALQDASVGLTPPTLDQVLVSAIDRSRHPDIQQAWVAGLNAGIFPALPTDDPLLGLETQRALAGAGFEVFAAERDDPLAERFLAYIALTRAARGVTISFAQFSPDGSVLQPSPLLDEIRAALGGLAVETLDAVPATLADLVRRAQSEPATTESGRRVAWLARRVADDAALAGRWGRLRAGQAFENAAAELATALRAPDWPEQVMWRGTPSAFEEYLQCPFRWFTRHALRLAERGAEPLQQQLGSQLHKGLAYVVQQALLRRAPVRTVAAEQWQRWCKEFAEQMERVAKSHRERALARWVGERLAGLVTIHVERWRRGKFEPLAVEQRFGGEARPGEAPPWPALEVPVDRKYVEIEGRIDRIDAAAEPDGRAFLIYDYKSTAGGGALNGDFLLGDGLQAFAYLGAAVAATAGRPLGALLAPLFPAIAKGNNDSDAAGDDSNCGTAGKGALDDELLAYRPVGRFDARAAELLDTDRTIANSVVASMQRKNEGGFYARSHVAAEGEISDRMQLAADTIALAAQGMANGVVAIRPLILGRTLACHHCDLRAVCRFERLRTGTNIRVAEKELPQLERPGGKETA